MSHTLLNRTMINGSFSRRYAIGRLMRGIENLAVKANVVGETVTFGTVDRAPAPAKFQGTRRFAALSSRRLNITNEQWDVPIAMRKLDVERDQTGQLNNVGTQLADRLTALQHKIVSDLIVANGTTTLDGIAMFSASHVLGKSGTQSNLLTNSDVPPLNVADTNMATPEEAAAIMNGITSYFMRYLDEQGEPLHMDMESLVFMVHPNHFGSFLMASNTNNMLAGGATNPLTGQVQNGMSYQVVANPRFSSVTQIHAFRVDHPTVKPFIWNEEKPISLSYLDENSEYCKTSGQMAVIGEWQGGWGYGDPLFAARATMS